MEDADLSIATIIGIKKQKKDMIKNGIAKRHDDQSISDDAFVIILFGLANSSATITNMLSAIAFVKKLIFD